MIEAQFISFFIVLLAAVFFSAVFRRLQLPWAIALIVGGILIGPNGLAIFEPNETISFLGEIGMVFLMFMAGLEMRPTLLGESWKSITGLGFVNGLVPFVVGLAIGLAFGFSIPVSLLIGVVFISSSVAVVIPSLESNNLLGTKLGNAIVGSTMLQDIGSLILVSVFFQTFAPVTTLPLLLFYILLFAFLVLLRKIIVFLERWVVRDGRFHEEIRFTLLIVLGVVLVFSVLGLHHIIAGFFTGFALSETLKNKLIKHQLHIISYGLFIPIFFVTVGASTNFNVFGEATAILGLATTIVLGLIISKLASGWFAARIARFSKNDSALIAVTSMPQLATTLAVAFAAGSTGLIGEELVTVFVILSIVTTMIAPFLTNMLMARRGPMLTTTRTSD